MKKTMNEYDAGEGDRQARLADAKETSTRLAALIRELTPSPRRNKRNVENVPVQNAKELKTWREKLRRIRNKVGADRLPLNLVKRRAALGEMRKFAGQIMYGQGTALSIASQHPNRYTPLRANMPAVPMSRMPLLADRFGTLRSQAESDMAAYEKTGALASRGSHVFEVARGSVQVKKSVEREVQHMFYTLYMAVLSLRDPTGHDAGYLLKNSAVPLLNGDGRRTTLRDLVGRHTSNTLQKRMSEASDPRAHALIRELQERVERLQESVVRLGTATIAKEAKNLRNRLRAETEQVGDLKTRLRECEARKIATRSTLARRGPMNGKPRHEVHENDTLEFWRT